MTAELKRALVDIAVRWQSSQHGDGTQEAACEELVDRLLAKLAAGSPEVIEAMALELVGGGMEWRRKKARAALAAGMKAAGES